MIFHRLGILSAVLVIAVITVSARSYGGVRENTSGLLATNLLSAFGVVRDSVVVPDGVEPVRQAITDAIGRGADVVFTTGGTGVSPRDLTPEATETLLIRRMHGLEEVMRANPRAPLPLSPVDTRALLKSTSALLLLSMLQVLWAAYATWWQQ